jgi:hypothetical protein
LLRSIHPSTGGSPVSVPPLDSSLLASLVGPSPVSSPVLVGSLVGSTVDVGVSVPVPGRTPELPDPPPSVVPDVTGSAVPPVLPSSPDDAPVHPSDADTTIMKTTRDPRP